MTAPTKKPRETKTAQGSKSLRPDTHAMIATLQREATRPMSHALADAVADFRDAVASTPLAALDPDTRYKCNRIYGNLDREFTPHITNEVTAALEPLLAWLEETCVPEISLTVPALTQASLNLLAVLRGQPMKELQSPSPAAYTDVPQQPAGKQPVPEEHVTTKQKKAKTEVARRSPARSRPGYVAPTREDKKALLTYVAPEVREAFKAIATLNGTTSEKLLREVVTSIIEQYQNPDQVKVAVKETVDRYQQTVNKVALRLVSSLK